VIVCVLLLSVLAFARADEETKTAQSTEKAEALKASGPAIGIGM
jgi:hypothetical protein